ncbi:hypothetical protein CDL12_23782 [Handroanthus impetiginosus]|uniref:Uncharacterized protein n=1 Tax=Handroanthus impetiginosus TaxID=429701 RepID=A0A2G9GEH3_9LAMI|nr:hypothetical protein CDL12_23782 [Handroanthus impetiginosus]
MVGSFSQVDLRPTFLSITLVVYVLITSNCSTMSEFLHQIITKQHIKTNPQLQSHAQSATNHLLRFFYPSFLTCLQNLIFFRTWEFTQIRQHQIFHYKFREIENKK